MPTLGELINNMAVKAGIASDDAKLKSLLATPELLNIQVDDSIVTALDNGLLSIEAAMNNHPKIKNKYFADVYDGIDKQLIKLIETDTFDQADVDEVKAEKSTSKKQELIVSKLKAMAKSAKGADKDEINKQLATAHEAARIAEAKVETTKQKYEAQIQDIQMKASLRAAFGKYKTIYDDLPEAVKTATFEAIVNQGLQDKNAILKTDEHGNLQLVGKDGSNVFGANHVHLTPASFLDQTFAPVLKVSGPTKPAATPTGSPAPVIPTKGNEGVEANAAFLKSRTDQVLADMASAPAPMI